MDVPHDAVLLRIFTSVSDRCGLSPLYIAIVEKARETHLAGATVLRGTLGFGHSSRLHRDSLLHLSQDLPVVVEIVDSEEKIDAFLPILDEMMESGLVTLEKAKVLQYGRTRSGFLERLKAEIKRHSGTPTVPSNPPGEEARGVVRCSMR
jgi:PII-like signaling protein